MLFFGISDFTVDRHRINAGANIFETSYSYVSESVTGSTTSKLFSISNNGIPNRIGV